MENPAFTYDQERGHQILPLEDIVKGKVPDYLPAVDNVGGRGADSSARQRRVAPSDGSDREGPPEEEEEDYSIFSFLPSHQEYKRKYNSIMKNDKMSYWLKVGMYVSLAVLYGAYLIAVLSIHSSIEQEDYWCDGDGFLLVLTAITVLMLTYFMIVKRLFGKKISEAVLKPISWKFNEIWQKRFFRTGFHVVILVVVVIFVIVDTSDDPKRLISLFGLVCLLLFGFVFSHAPRKVVWRHVLWGLALQFILGLLILRWSVGRAVFGCMGQKVSNFLAFTDIGSKFVFGKLVDPDGIFAFKVLPVVLFFSFCIQILYYYGIMQWVVIKLGWLLQVTVGTTACESVNAAANIFLGQTEAPLLIKPYLPLMTKSELHAVLTGGFATIAGSVMAAYILFGVSASHLLSASVMSAPAALAYAKLFYPETEKSRTEAKDIPVVKGTEANALHAAIEGVVTAIPLVANITANLITFIAFIGFFNAIFNWSCQLVNVEDGVCTLENISGYVFMPLAWCMGVAWEECHTVGTLIGLKTIVNEFIAYDSLAKMIKAGTLSARAQIIATYALCGFSNIGAIGIQLGGIGALAPDRRADIAQVIVRAVIAGSAACFLTGCVAGVLINDESLSIGSKNATDISNDTVISAGL